MARRFTWILRVVLAIFATVLVFFILYEGFVFLRAGDAPKWVIAIVAIVWGVGGVAVLYYLFNWLVEQLPLEWTARLQPFIFVGPALVLLLWFLALPTVRTLYLSLFGRFGPQAPPLSMLFTAPGQYFAGLSGQFVGLGNYVAVFTDASMLEALRNNLLFWILIATPLTVISGLLIAVLADRSGWERTAKSLIFLPMAISFVGASVIWRLCLRVQSAGFPPDWPPQRGRGGPWRPAARLDTIHGHRPLEQSLPGRHRPLAPDRICHGDLLGRHQGHPR